MRSLLIGRVILSTGVHTHPPVPVVVKIPAHLQGDGQLIIHLWFATVHSELTHTIGMSAGEYSRTRSYFFPSSVCTGD